MNVIHNIAQGFYGFMYVCNRDYKIEFMNDNLIRRVGYNAKGESCYKAIQGLDEICPWCPNHEVLSGEVVRLEIRNPKDERWYLIVNAPFYFEDVSRLSMFIDITERKLAEESMMNERESITVKRR